MSNTQILREALSTREGIVRMAPCWVPRTFLMPGGRLKLHPDDLDALRTHRGGIDERWFSSTTNAADRPGTPPDKGLSYIGRYGARVQLTVAIGEMGIPSHRNCWSKKLRRSMITTWIASSACWVGTKSILNSANTTRCTRSRCAKKAPWPSLPSAKCGVTYGMPWFSATELTVMPGHTVTAAKPQAGVQITNLGAKEKLVTLKHFGPGNPDAAQNNKK